MYYIKIINIKLSKYCNNDNIINILIINNYNNIIINN